MAAVAGLYGLGPDVNSQRRRGQDKCGQTQHTQQTPDAFSEQ